MCIDAGEQFCANCTILSNYSLWFTYSTTTTIIHVSHSCCTHGSRRRKIFYL